LSNRIAARSYSSDAKGSSADLRHQEFSERFMRIIRTAKVEPSKSQYFDPSATVGDKELAATLTRIFASNKVEVTDELLERRQKLREKYPELFKDISDDDIAY
ncbi:hypothetical protein LPJ70_007196, partial [Coemansia sp. RSA 2708]